MSAQSRSVLLQALIAGTAVAGAAVAVAGVTHADLSHPAVLASLVALAFGAELFAVGLFGNSHVSVSGGAIMACGALFGLFGVALAAVAVAIAGQIRTQRPALKTTFNAATFAIAGAAYVATFRALGGDAVALSFPHILVPALVAGVANMAVNSALVTGAIALDRAESPLDVWRRNFLWLVPQYVVLGAAAAGMAVAAAQFGPWALLLFALPAASLAESLRVRAQAMGRISALALEPLPGQRTAA